MGITRSILVILALAIPTAHAAKAPPPPTTQGQTVLLVNAVEPELTHSHLGVTAFSTSEKQLENDWAIDQVAQVAATSLIEQAGYRVVLADTTPEQREALRSRKLSKGGWTKPSLRPELSTWLRQQTTAKDAVVVVVLRTYDRQFAPNIYAYYSGYGLMTAHGDPPRFAFLFANIGVAVLSGDPFMFASSAKVRESDCRKRIDVASIHTPSFKTLTADALRPYQLDLEVLVQRRIRQDLVASGLLPGNVEKCVIAKS